MQIYKTKIKKLPGTHWPRLSKTAFFIYKKISLKTKRRPYIRSTYFNRQKVFLGLFWQHLFRKNLRDKTRRVALFPCAIELIRKNRHEPISKENPNRKGEILHRFTGLTPDNEIFFVQIKENRRNNHK